MRSFRRARVMRERRHARRAAMWAGRGVVVAVGALGGPVLLAPGAQAATTSYTYTVTTNQDGPAGACTGAGVDWSCETLRDALAAADTIQPPATTRSPSRAA